MIINGFNSEDYRYFRNKETGEITKFFCDSLEKYLFSDNYNLRLREHTKAYTIKPYPKDKAFNLLEFICMQDPIVFQYDDYLSANFDTKDFLLITEWLKNKMASKKITNPFWGQTIQETNQEMFQKLYEGERIGYENNLIATKEECEVQTIHNTLNAIQELFQFKGPIAGFKIPFFKDEVWHLVNPAVSLLLLNQKFIRDMYASEEILGEEKEVLFYEEYKDNIPNTTIRYYDLKEDVSIAQVHELDNECSLEDFNHGYDSLILRKYGKLLFCKENICNYRNNLKVKTIAIQFPDSIYDRKIEKEVLKIANRVPLEEAVVNYQKDQEALKEKEKQEEIEELILKYPRKFHKSHLKPEEFFNKEKTQAKLNLVRVLKDIANKKSN